MKNIKQFSAFILAVLTLCGCSDLRDGGSYSSKTKARISVSIAGIDKSSARNTALPPSAADLNKLSDFVLRGKYSGGQEQELASASTYTELSQKQIEVQAGYWSFTLNVKYSGIDFSGNIERQEIKLDSPNTLSFVLSSAATNGGFTITLGYIGNAALAVSTLYKWPDKTPTDVSVETTLNPSDISGTVKFEVPYEGDSSADSSGIPSGSYRAEIVFYADAEKTVRLSTYPAIVRIAGGLVSTLTDSMTLDEAYSIEYKCLCNDEDPQDLLDLGSGVTSSLTLPLVYSRKSEAFNLPQYLNLSGFHFAGWYADDACTESVDGIPEKSTGDKTFYARFIDTIYVKAGGESYESGTSAGTAKSKPLASINAAVDKIMEYSDDSVAWNIVIDGTVTGAQNVLSDLTTAHAQSLKIKGAHAVTEGEELKDTIDGGYSGGGASAGGSLVLSIETAVPVTLENLKIKGGLVASCGAGLIVGDGAQVSTSGVVCITENSAPCGAGVYVQGKFTVNDGCTITDNIATDQGGGVYVEGTLELCGGAIRGNTVDSTTGKGAGVYNKGTLRMSDTGSVAADNEVYLESGTTITIAGALSREAYVATITPQVYEDNLEVLALADTLTQDTSIDEEYGKFDVVPNEQIEYCLNSAGEIEVKKDVYVSSSSSTHSGNDTTGDGSAFKPYATLQTAVTKIKALAEHNPADYVIHVSGDTDCSTVLSVNTVKTVNGEDQQVEGTLGEFTGSTLKICGTNKEQDKLKGWPTVSDGKDLLAITCPNQVTVENLTLYGLATNNRHAALFADLLADVTVKNCIITGNNQTYGTDSAGGGIYNKGKMTVSDCTITGNNSIAGAGVSNAGWMKLERCIISENGNIGNGASSGAGIYNASITSNSYNGELNIINCQIINNILGKKSLNNTTTGKSGAGIYINGGTVTIEDSEITGNTNIKPTANANALYGGGIYLRPDVNSVRLNLKGKVIIQNNTNYDGIENNVYIDRKKTTIKLVNITDSLDQDSRIGITISDTPALTSSFVFTNGINYSNLTTDQLSQVFTSDNKDYDVIFETGAEGILARKNYSVGDLLLNDCSLVPYSETSPFTAEQIGKAVGIVYALDENGAPRSILGLKNSGETTYSWAPNGTTGNSTDFTDIGVTQVSAEPADGTPYCQFEYAGSSYYLTGDLDGSDNWEYIKTQDSAGTSNAAANYPAFNWVNDYASTAGLTGDYAEGWYMPSIAELWYIYKNREKLNAVLSAINTVSAGAATTLGNEWDYLSSSQLASNEYVIWKLIFSDGEVSQNNYKESAQHVCVVRSANATPEYAVIFSTNGGSLIASQKVQKNQTATAPETVPTKSGYIFGGWYTSSDGGTTLSSEPFDFNTEITGHTVLYAKWSDFVLVEGATINGAVSSSSVFVSGKTVTIENLYVCNHEVTQGEFTKIMGVNPSNFNSNPAEGEIQENRPVDQVNWYMTIAYCNKRSLAENLTPCYSVEGISDWESLNFSDIPTTDNSNWNKASCDFTADGYRLPTHAEWEYAARGGNGLTGAQMIFSGHNTSLPDVGWYIDNASSMTHEVRKKSPNALGLYDMSGNLYEWVWDAYNADGSSHYDCGGSWLSYYSDCYVYSFSNPNSSWSNYGDGSYFGFRVVRTAN